MHIVVNNGRCRIIVLALVVDMQKRSSRRVFCFYFINVIQSTQLINNNYPGIVSGSAVTVIWDT